MWSVCRKHVAVARANPSPWLPILSSRPRTMAPSPIPVTFLLGTPSAAGTAITGVTTGTGKWVYVTGPNYLTVTFTSIGTTSGGTILIEETDAIDDGLNATPSQLLSQAASGFSGNAKLCSHIAIG